ncbi:hypothetical protein [Methylobacter tundripaludum]|uniref:hypothetical protein n=1 Tax=Methylobacter tundripaludum TaxID=173365 RepID=UPI0002ED6F25|nr:hypothetical protein [Methylobacter tundripaludum]
MGQQLINVQKQDVGRNKPAWRKQGWVFPAKLRNKPETPPRATLGWPYSGLRRDVYNDERSG